MFKYFLLAALLFLGALFCSVSKVNAEENVNVVINEVMANAPAPETDLEWLELYNPLAEDVDLNGWKIDTKVISDDAAIIPAKSYLIIARDKNAFLAQYLDFDYSIPVIQVSINLANSNDEVILEPKDGLWKDIFAWGPDKTGDNYSWEKKDALLSTDDNLFKSNVLGGTPGEENSVTKLKPPKSPIGLSPINDEIIQNADKITLSWSIEEDVNYELIVANNSELTDPIIEETSLRSSEYILEDLQYGKYYWQVIANNEIGKSESTIYNFEYTEPVYSKAIIVNELMADPEGDEAIGEWIELYNNSSEKVPLGGWFIEDLEGSIHRYTIPTGVTIDPKSYYLIDRQDSGTTLNNTTDGARLLNPKEEVVSTSDSFSDGKSGWAWMRQSNGDWVWTTTPTPKKLNLFTSAETESDSNDDEENEPNQEEVVLEINSDPIEIETGTYKQYENKKVKMTGEVVTTSGNTFYLDDGSGTVKIYIQDKTGIDKPKMYKGDLVEVVGIVNIYRGAWRILPQVQDDIKILKTAKLVEGSSAKTVKAASTSAKSSTTKTTPSSANTPKVSSDNKNTILTNKDQTDNEGGMVLVKSSTPTWVQFAKSLTGLSIVFLILLVFKVISYSKVRIIGGRFGEDNA